MTANYNQGKIVMNQWRCISCDTLNKIWEKKCFSCGMTFRGRNQMKTYQYLLLMRKLPDLIPDVIPEQKKPLEELPSENDEYDLDYDNDDE